MNTWKNFVKFILIQNYSKIKIWNNEKYIKNNPSFMYI